MPSTPPQPLAQLKQISKSFGPVRVLQNVDFTIHPHETHILAGENGAGKSTLIKILAGVHTDFTGEIRLAGTPVRPRGPRHANQLGIAVIHQELSLVPSLSIADNIFLGAWPTRAGFIQQRRQQQAARKTLAQLGLDLDVRQSAGDLPIAAQQLVEIAKALRLNAHILVLDEPTSALNAPDVEKLFTLLAQLKDRGTGLVYITHKMEEIVRIADRITVLRDGRLVESAPAADLPPNRLIRQMVGRDITEQFPRHATTPGDVRLRVDNLTVPGPRRTGPPTVDRASLHVRAGEILGLAGLQGSGNSALLLGLFGAFGRRAAGRVTLDGQPFAITSPTAAIQRGLALLTNDRKQTGLVLGMSVTANATLADLPNLCTLGWRRPRQERRATASLTDQLHLRAASLDMPVAQLSGGNQQKVALAKWLQTKPRVLLLDEPTRGVDVGAKREVYELINNWTQAGIAIILITSEMPELLSLSDRIAVMHRGRIAVTLDRADATADRVLAAAMGRPHAEVSA
jgi:ribose transport system ATP-binding protein